MPALRALREHFQNELVVIGVHSAKFPSEKLTANIREAVLRHGIEHPVVNDAGFKIWNSYAVHAWPTIILIDPRGKIAYEMSGEVLAGELIPQIEQLINAYDQEGLIDRRPLELKEEREAEPLRPLDFPAQVLPDGERLFVADSGHNRILELRLDAPGEGAEVERVFGSGEAGLKDGPAGQAQFNGPRGLALAAGKLYVADTENHAIRFIDLESGEVKTLAGTGEKGHGRFKFGEPTEMPLRSPWDVLALGPDQPGENPILFIAMAGSHQIWLILQDGRLGVFAGNGSEALADGSLGEASFNQPSGMAFGMGHLFVADPEASAIRAISLGEHAQVMTLIGRGLFEFGDLDGIGQEVRLQHPAGVAYAEGRVYIADSYNHKIKVLDPTTGEVQTLIGTGESGCEDGSFSQATLYQPEGLDVQDGRIYIADTNNHVIRIGDLKEQKVFTLALRGLERLQSESFEAALITLSPIDLKPGLRQVEFGLGIPDGYKLNPEAPTSLQVDDGPVYQFKDGQPVVFEVNVLTETTLNLDLTVYYCQEKTAQLCLIYMARLALPVQVNDKSPDRAKVIYSF